MIILGGTLYFKLIKLLCVPTLHIFGVILFIRRLGGGGENGLRSVIECYITRLFNN